MAKLTLADLKKLREDKRKEIVKRDSHDKRVRVVISMGTCGIAAGAKDVFSAFLDEIDALGLTDVAVTQTGCMGLCYAEPTVEVFTPGMPEIVYGNVKADLVRKIVKEHIVEGRIVEGNVFGKPLADIVK